MSSHTDTEIFVSEVVEIKKEIIIDKSFDNDETRLFDGMEQCADCNCDSDCGDCGNCTTW